MQEKYHLFYVWPYGNESKYESFDHEEDLIKRVKELNDEAVKFRAIWGQKLEFEPATVVETWRVKQ